jgi:hypothetical protein
MILFKNNIPGNNFSSQYSNPERSTSQETSWAVITLKQYVGMLHRSMFQKHLNRRDGQHASNIKDTYKGFALD